MIDPRDIDQMARTMVAENAHGSPAEYDAIAHVIINRAHSNNPDWGNGTIYGVVHHPKQFSPWNDPNASNYPGRISSLSPAYKSAYSIAENALNGDDDPTHGAIQYHATSMNPPPKWAKGRQGQQIGAHTFYGPVEPAGQVAQAKQPEQPEADWGEGLMPKAAPPEPEQTAGEAVPTGDEHEDWGPHVSAAAEPAQPPPEPEKPVDTMPDVALGGENLITEGWKKAPLGTAAAAASLGIPLAATGMIGTGVGAAALPASIRWGLGAGLGFGASQAHIPFGEEGAALFHKLVSIVEGMAGH